MQNRAQQWDRYSFHIERISSLKNVGNFQQSWILCSIYGLFVARSWDFWKGLRVV